jgi:uncharacterized protein YcfJ
MDMKRNMIGTLSLVALLAVGCQTTNPSAKNSAIGGAAVGAAAGGILASGGGGMSGKEGALVGGLVGGLLGHHSGKQAEENQQLRSERDAAVAQANTRVVDVHNSNGSTTPVTLHKVGDKWQGPRGEQYTSVPSQAQLAPVYGM